MLKTSCVTRCCTGCCSSARSPARCRMNSGQLPGSGVAADPRVPHLAVHKYFGVDWAVVWKIAQEEPPLLERQILAIMRTEYPALAQSYEDGSDPGTASLRDPRFGGSRDPPAEELLQQLRLLPWNSRRKSGITPAYRCPASAALGLGGVASWASVRVPHGSLRYVAYTMEV